MADFFRGLSGGMQTGLQLGQQLRQRRMEDELAQAYAKPETFRGYTPEQGQQLEAMANAINPETGRPYYNVQAGQGGNYTVTPDFTESQIPRTGVDTGSQYGVAPVDLQATGLGRAGVVSQPIPFNQQQVQEYGGRRVAGQFDPEQLRGLQMREAARVLGSYGDPVRAAQLESDALRMEREAEERPLRLRNLQQQIETGDLTIDEKKRLAEEQANIGKAREELRELRAKGPLTAAAIADVSGRYKLDPTTFLKAEDAVNTIEIKDLKRNLSTAALKGEAGLNQFLADKFDPDKTDNFKPMITKRKDGNFVVTYGDRVLEEYGAHKNMMSLVGGVINIIDQNPFDTLKTLSTLETQAAQREESKAGIGLKNAQAKYYAGGGRQTERAPVILVNDKGEPTPVYMDRLPVVDGVVQLPQGLRMPRDVQQATAAQNRAYEMLTKSDAWERAERAGDTATMNKLMVNRGLDPAQFGGTGMMGWGEQGSTTTQATASGQPTQQSMAAPARVPSAGLMTPQQLAAAQQQQQVQTQEQQQRSVSAGVRASGLGREAYMLRQEAAGYTPTIIQQMTPQQADQFRRRYGEYLTPAQTRAVNQAM
jgi:hypothetical protein